MKVLYLIDSLGHGGAERSLLSIAPALIARSIDLEVGTLGGADDLAESFADAGVPISNLLSRPGGAARSVRRWIKARNPDLVHTTLFRSDIAGRLACLALPVPLATSLVSVAYGPEQAKDPRVGHVKLYVARRIDAMTARRVTRWHAITDHVATVMSSRLRIPRHRIEVIPRGRDPETLGRRTEARRTKARVDLELDPETPVVLAAARHEFQKGLDILIRAVPDLLREAAGTRVLIAGRNGNQTARLKGLVKELELDGVVTFLGARQDLDDIMCAADVLVVPSRWEGLCGVLLEAMALELPIVASDLPPVREVLGDDGGLLVPIADTQGLATALGTVLADRSAFEPRLRRARERFVREFSIDTIADRMAGFYDRVVHDDHNG